MRTLGCPSARVDLVGGPDVVVPPAGAPPDDGIAPALCHRVVETRTPVLVTDVREDPPAVPDAGAAGSGLVAFAGVPLFAGGGCAGSLCVADTTPRDWGPDDLSVLEDLAAAATAELDRRALAAERDDAAGAPAGRRSGSAPSWRAWPRGSSCTPPTARSSPATPPPSGSSG
jgi:GAF domain-containing protein